jgi:hypothetical protein
MLIAGIPLAAVTSTGQSDLPTVPVLQSHEGRTRGSTSDVFLHALRAVLEQGLLLPKPFTPQELRNVVATKA